jgi:hypothetical protein
MGLFDSIRNAIFGHSAAASAAPAQAQPTRAPAAAAGTSSTATAAPPAPPQAPAPVDVEAILNGLAAGNPQKLNWQSSIVDLMKLLGLDSSLQNRTLLAKELGYTADTSDSAAMNVWLHKQVMRKLAESGGKVPASLRD